MSILNEVDGFDFIRTYESPANKHLNNKERRPTCLMWNIRTWHDNDYFYIEIFQGDAFKVYPIDTLVPEDILDKIKNDNKTFLYICNSHEAFLDIVEPLYESLVIDEGIPARKIYIANEAFDLNQEVKRYADKNNLEYMNCELILEFEQQVSMQVNIFGLDGQTMLTDKSYEKRFLNFNRRWRLHRPVLVALLKIKGLLNHGYVSLAHADDNNNWNNIYPWIKAHYKSDIEFSELFEKHENEIINMPNLYLDTDDLVTNRALIEKQSLYLYENSLVSIVSETTFYQDKMNKARFLSEKIFKPIGIGHPFILVTVPKSLEALKTLGYKTFHPYIDESYDDEFDDNLRMKKIIKEIERISNFTDQEVKTFCQNVKSICDFNQELLKSKTLPYIKGCDSVIGLRDNNKKSLLHSYFVKKTL